MQNLILLEDELVLREELTEFLTDSGFRVDAVADLSAFRQQYDPAKHRIALIDLGLPDGDGMDLIRELRARGNPIGIVVLTARGKTRDKIQGLDIGADYYLAKTTDLDELAATLGALARRLAATAPVQCWILDASPRRLVAPGYGPIPLSQQDFLVLRVLMRNQGIAVPRQLIIETLGEDFLTYDQRRLDTQMRRLRRKVEDAIGEELPVNTLRNAGYCFYANAEVHE